MENLCLGPVETNQAGHAGFGFGRRICVGKELANDSLFISTVRMLWAAKLVPARDKNGNKVTLDTETIVDAGHCRHGLVSIFSSGGFHDWLICWGCSRPVPYDYVAKPQFTKVESVLAEEHERFGIQKGIDA